MVLDSKRCDFKSCLLSWCHEFSCRYISPRHSNGRSIVGLSWCASTAQEKILAREFLLGGPRPAWSPLFVFHNGDPFKAIAHSFDNVSRAEDLIAGETPIYTSMSVLLLFPPGPHLPVFPSESEDMQPPLMKVKNSPTSNTPRTTSAPARTRSPSHTAPAGSSYPPAPQTHAPPRCTD